MLIHFSGKSLRAPKRFLRTFCTSSSQTPNGENKNSDFKGIKKPSRAVLSLGYDSKNSTGFDKYSVDFSSEIDMLKAHEHSYNRPRLGMLAKAVYIPKISVKTVAPFMYKEEEDASHFFSIQKKQKKNVYITPKAKQPLYMLGIQSLFGKVSCAVVTNSGEIVANSERKLFTHQNTAGTTSREVLKEFLEQNLGDFETGGDQNVVSEAMKTAGVGYKDLAGIAVTIGPGESFSVEYALRFAQKAGLKNYIPVIAVNNHEAHIFENRRSQVAKGDLAPLEFPFFNVIASSKITQCVYTKGVSSHKIFGTTIDLGIGQCFDKIYSKAFRPYLDVLNNKELQEKHLMNLASQKVYRTMSDFKFLEQEDPYGGQFIENLARLGNPHELKYSIPMQRDNSTDMSYTGFWTTVHHSISSKKSFFEKEPNADQVEYLCDVAASAQYAAFRQIDMKARRGLEIAQKLKVPLNAINLSGGVASNASLQKVMSEISSDYDLPLITPSSSNSTDSASSVAWMGWEYLNSGLMTDIRAKSIYPLNFIPLGNYIDFIPGSLKKSSQFKKHASRWQMQ